MIAQSHYAVGELGRKEALGHTLETQIRDALMPIIRFLEMATSGSHTRKVYATFPQLLVASVPSSEDSPQCSKPPRTRGNRGCFPTWLEFRNIRPLCGRKHT